MNSFTSAICHKIALDRKICFGRSHIAKLTIFICMRPLRPGFTSKCHLGPEFAPEFGSGCLVISFGVFGICIETMGRHSWTYIVCSWAHPTTIIKVVFPQIGIPDYRIGRVMFGRFPKRYTKIVRKIMRVYIALIVNTWASHFPKLNQLA